MTGVTWRVALTEDDTDALSGLAEPVIVSPGDPIRRGEHPQALFLLRHGETQVGLERRGEPVEVARLQPGALLGDMSFVSGPTWDTT